MTLAECQLCINAYDEDGDGVLDYPEFRRMLIIDDSFRGNGPLVNLEKRNPSLIEDSTRLSYEVEYAVVRIVLQEMQLQTNLENLRRDLI